MLDRHLACWSDVYPLQRLRQAYAGALPIAIVQAALMWRMIVSGLAPSRRFEVVHPDPRRINFTVSAQLRRILRWMEKDASWPWHTIL